MNEVELARYRSLLLLHVRARQIGRQYATRFDTSDVVQEALLRATRAGEQLASLQEQDRARWLRKVVDRVVIDLIREHGAEKRSPNREEVIADGSPLDAYVAATQPGPSTLAIRAEELLLLAEKLQQLPEAERDALIAHFVLGLPINDVAERLGRTVKGAAGLLFRGKLRLRALLTGGTLE